ncbi:hypothetical protein M407DRAFT_8031 [Tulasnella calospora MUT 4182]|uniref:Uncharacterized protein n=1 Tax=Tulasnella calospora MUT 4182 TaxID=1051891 RepID=A0A0C3QHH7_9AGAM|nr:hypothetical protein M407DRAFT_8031 [Tulasnella calospora MUT 4182]
MPLSFRSTEKDALSDDLQHLNPSSPDGTYHETHPTHPLRKTNSSSGRRLFGFIPAVFVLLVTLGLVTLIMGWLLAFQYGPAQGGIGLGPAFRNGSFVLFEGERKGDADKRGGSHLRVLTWSSWGVRPTRSLDGIFLPDLARAGDWRRPRLPRLFSEALFFATTVWILAKAVWGVDTWLHYVSQAVPFALQVPAIDTVPLLAVGFNDTLCDSWSRDDHGSQYVAQGYPCLAEYEGWALYNTEMMPKGFNALVNQSSTFQVVTLADAQDTAIVVPKQSRGYTFQASTFGARTACTSLNSQCDNDGGGVTTNCTRAGYPGLPHRDGVQLDNADDQSISSSVFGLVEGIMGGTQMGATDLPSKGQTPNPTTLGIQLRWDSRLQSAENYVFVPEDAESAVDTMPKPKVTLYAGCQVTFLNVTVWHDGASDTWAMVNSSASSSDLTSILWLPMLYQFITEKLASNVENDARMQTRDNVMAALNQNIGRLALAAASGYFQPIEAADVHLSINDAILSIYPVAPVVCLILLLLLYAALAVAIFTSSWFTSDKTIVVPAEMSPSGEHEERSMVALTQTWLVDPMPLVALAFPGEDGKDHMRSVAKSTNQMVYDGHEGDSRLSIGLHDGGKVFGLRKRGDRREDGE